MEEIMNKYNVISIFLTLLFLIMSPVHGMDYLYKGYDATKKFVQKHPYWTSAAGITVTAGGLYYLWQKNRAAYGKNPISQDSDYSVVFRTKGDIDGQIFENVSGQKKNNPIRLYNPVYCKKDYYIQDLDITISEDDIKPSQKGFIAATTIQSALRGYQQCKNLHNIIQSTVTIQSATRGYKARELQKEKGNISPVQENGQTWQECENPLKYYDIDQKNIDEHKKFIAQATIYPFVSNTFEITGADLLKSNNSDLFKEQVLAEQEAIKRGARYTIELLKEKSLLNEPDFYAQMHGYDKEKHPNFPPHNTIEDYAQALRDLCSFFYYIGCDQTRLDHRGFTEGTLYIQDPYGHLKQFLNIFIQKTNIDATTKKEKPKFNERISTHKFGKQQYGIDLWSDEKPWLCRFKHLLVGFDAKGVWMKPEKHGIDSWTDFFWHGVDLAQTKAVKLISRFTGSLGDDAPEYNKERVPAWETNEFKKLFPDCTQKDMTLGSMYIYAQEALKNGPKNALPIKTFIDMLQCHYNHLNDRHGREIRLTSNDMIAACMYTTDCIELMNFLKDFMHLKHSVTQYQHGNYDYFGNIQLPTSKNLRDSINRKHITEDEAYRNLEQQIVSFIQTYKQIASAVNNTFCANYFKNLIHVLELKHGEGTLKTEIGYQPLFESQFHDDVFEKSKQKKQQQESQKNRELLSCAVMNRLQAFKQESLGIISKIFPDYRATGNLFDKKQAEAISYKPLRDYLKTYILDLQQTEGLRKTTEFRVFAGQQHTGNDFIHYNEPIIRTLFELALSVKTEAQQKEALICCKAIKEIWDTVLYQDIPALAEQYGKIFSLSKEGQKLVQSCIYQADKQFEEMTQFYKDIYQELENKIEDEDWKQTYQMIQEKKKNDYTIRKETIVNFCRLAENELSFKEAIMQELTFVIKADLACREVEGNLEFDWLTKSEAFKKLAGDQNKGYVSYVTDYATAATGYVTSFWTKK
jgi:hypothetical protein